MQTFTERGKEKMNDSDLQKIVDFLENIEYEINPDMDKYYSFKIVMNNCKETTYYFRKKDVSSQQSVEGSK